VTQPKKVVLTAQVAPERPHRLVLHFNSETPAPDRLFNSVIRSATGLDGLREVTLDLPDGDPRGREVLASVGAAALQCGFELRTTVSARQVFDWGAHTFSACRQVDLRVDSERTPALRLAPLVYAAAGALHAESRVVGLHVLLDRSLITKLSPSRLRIWLDRADFVTLVAPRLREPDFTHADLVSLFERLSPLWESPDRFFHLQVDRSIKPAFFPWNLLSVTCPAADLALHLQADGGLYLCASRTPFASIENPALFADAVERHLAKCEGEMCEGLSLDAR